MQKFKRKVSDIHKYNFLFLCKLRPSISQTHAPWIPADQQTQCRGLSHVFLVNLWIDLPD